MKCSKYLLCLEILLFFGFWSVKALADHAADQHAAGLDITFYDVSFPDGMVGYAVGMYGTIAKSENGGLTWRKVRFPFKKSLYAVHFLDKDNGIVVGDNQFIGFTKDGGETWDKAKCKNCDSPNESFSAIGMDEGGNIIIGGQSGLCAFGDWNSMIFEQTRVSSANIISVILPRPDLCYLFSNQKIHVSKDLGRTFTQITSNLNSTILDVVMLSDQIGFAAGTKGVMYKTEDGGNVWKSISLASTNIDFYGLMIDGKEIFLVGNFNGVIHTQDSPTPWTIMTAFREVDLNVSFHSLTVTKNALVAVGEDGHILMSKNNGQRWDVVSNFL